MIKTNNLWHIYNPESDPIEALRGINLSIEKGKNVSIVGPNGSGKTTLVKHFNGLLKPSKGSVKVDNEDVSKKTIAEMAQKVGFVFQNPEHQIFAKNVTEEVEFGPKNLGIEADEKIDDVLKKLGLEKYKKRSPHNLSGGEKQRLAIASVLITDPDYLILDEPTIGLDLNELKKVIEIMRKIKKKDKTVITITHDLELAKESDQIIVLKEGEIKSYGGSKKILTEGSLDKIGLGQLEEVKICKELGIEPTTSIESIARLLKGV